MQRQVFAEQFPFLTSKLELGAPVQSANNELFAVLAPRWSNKSILKLAGKADTVDLGGGGRYLLAHMKSERKLAVIDMVLAKQVSTLPLNDNGHFAAGAREIVTLDPFSEKITVYGIGTWQENRQGPFPKELVGRDIHQLCWGYSSTGPVFIYLPREKRTLALNTKTFKVSEITWPHFGPRNAYGPLAMRSSPDGSMLLGYGGGWGGLARILFENGEPKDVTDKIAFSGGLFALPSVDAKWIYVPHGIFSRNLARAELPEQQNRYIVPAMEPGYFLVMAPTGRQLAVWKNNRVNLTAVKDPEVYTEDRRKRFVLPKMEELRTGNLLSWEHRIFYFPRAGMLVTISGEADQVIFRRVELPTSARLKD